LYFLLGGKIMAKKVKKNYLVSPDGSVVPMADGELSLSVKQKAVGGLIQYAYCKKRGVDVIVNEEGLIHGMAYNGYATSLVENDGLVGPAIVSGVNAEKAIELVKWVEPRNQRPKGNDLASQLGAMILQW
jgi:hypothetical protein